VNHDYDSTDVRWDAFLQHFIWTAPVEELLMYAAAREAMQKNKEQSS
jgi:hypothetical protein